MTGAMAGMAPAKPLGSVLKRFSVALLLAGTVLALPACARPPMAPVPVPTT